MHISIPIADSMEFIFTEVSPLISKCQIKVLYVGDNRNGTSISRDTAREMGKYLPGSPIVGFYNKENKDFEEHNRDFEITNDKFSIIDITKPYGFVPTDAKVWFQKYYDDNQVEREYLVTEGYIWTSAYPEANRILEEGNNQSMELNNDSVNGYWSGELNSKDRFFIINEALIEKLCILGENFEPCFEGAQIKANFSLQEEFSKLRESMFSMMDDFKEVINKGGLFALPEEKDKKDEAEVKDLEVKDPDKKDEGQEDPKKDYAEDKKDKEEEKKSDDSDKENKDDSEDKTDDEKKDDEDYGCKKKYNLDEVVEYTELKTQYSELEAKLQDLETKYSALEAEKTSLSETIEPLKQFKLEQERKDKQAMIDTFYMLSDEDKKDVVENIDTYSLNDIEAKLAVICVRNKVDFSLDKDKEKKDDFTFNLNNLDNQEEDGVPAWIKAVKQTEASNM